MAVRLFAIMEKKFGRASAAGDIVSGAHGRATRRYSAKKTIDAFVVFAGPDPAARLRRPFFCVHAVGGNVLEYHDLARHLGSDQPFYGLQSRGLDGTQSPHTRIPEMAAHYVKEIREFQPRAPYLIGGRSLGGIIAFEMACQLRSQGQEVGLLALLDSYPVGYHKRSLDAGALKSRAGRIVSRMGTHSSNLRGLSLQGKLIYAHRQVEIRHAEAQEQVMADDLSFL